MAVGGVGLPSSGWVPPVGFVMTTGSSTSPGVTYAGTSWSQITNCFLIGAGGSYSLGSTGGSSTHTLTVAQMPAHSHSGSITSVGNHTHTFSSRNGTSQSYYIQDGSGCKYTVTKTTSSSGSHSHSVTINNNGNGAAFNIMNPYVGKYIWRRVG